jgi:hypothetical protein
MQRYFRPVLREISGNVPQSTSSSSSGGVSSDQSAAVSLKRAASPSHPDTGNVKRIALDLSKNEPATEYVRDKLAYQISLTQDRNNAQRALLSNSIAIASPDPFLDSQLLQSQQILAKADEESEEADNDTFDDDDGDDAPRRLTTQRARSDQWLAAQKDASISHTPEGKPLTLSYEQMANIYRI